MADPFDDAEKMAVKPVEALCDRIDWLRDQQIMLSVGTQGVISEAHKTSKRIEGFSADLRWIKALLIIMLAWQIASSVYSSAPAQALMASL